MRSIRKNAVVAVSLTVGAALSLAGCGSSDSNGSGSGAKTYVDGATFTMASSSDPGALDPQSGVGQALFQANVLAYDSLVSLDTKGQIQSQLAKSWKVDGTTVTFDLNDGVTCADGSPFTAQTAADNITYVENPKNKSPYLGVFVPAGAKATASGSTVTVTLASPSPFVLAAFANLPMVCDAGMKDRSTLKSATDGTGPYVLSEAVPGDHYTYDVRKGYTWGPAGATTAEKGMPAKIVVKVIENPTTTANELIAGTLNSAAVLGPDAQRLSAMKLFQVDTLAMIGEEWLNHAKGHATSDPAVRKALTQAVDLNALMKALTGGTGKTPTQLTLLPPTVCTYDAISGNLPSFDAAAADATLEAAGYAKGSDGFYAKDGKKVTINLLVDSAMGTGAGAAGELAVKAWKDAGIDASFQQKGTAALQGTLFGSGDWDLAWEPVNVSNPDQVVPFLSGAGAADGGTNFSGIDNADYSADVTKAMAMNGAEGCDTWKAAEAALYQQSDIVPFAANVLPSFGKGAEFSFLGSLVPTSIRMLG